MPSKGKRVAVRQGSLSRRRSNRSASGPAGVAAGAVLDGGDGGGGGSTASATATATATAASGMAAGAARPAGGRPAQQPRGRRRERPAAYNHVGSELIRIGIFASVALAALIAVSFVL